MDELLRHPPGDSGQGPEPTEQLDTFLQRLVLRRPWEVRAAQWRAWELAEAAFGQGVSVRLTGKGSYQSFRGLLTFTVPFSTLGDHRMRESTFLSWARMDPILAQVPLVFVFEPDPVPVP
jgi:hypothetical protein